MELIVVFDPKFWRSILLEKKKKSHIIGKKFAQKVDDPAYDKWKGKDALVKFWLINSMTDKLISNFVQCETTKRVWDAMRKDQLNVYDFSQIYELMKRSF